MLQPELDEKAAGLSPNIVELISRFNKLSRWLAYEVCILPDIKDRRQLLEKYVAVAAAARDIRSYSVVMVVMGAMSSTAVFRLRKLGKLCPGRRSRVMPT